MGTKYFIAAAFATALIMSANVSFAGEDEDGVGLEYAIAYGGRLYDNWIEITNADEPPSKTNKAYPQDKGKARKTKSWQCVSCHGWDYKGKDGVYAKDERNATGIIGVMGAAGKDPEELVKVITEGHGILPDEDMMVEEEAARLAAFISKGLIDTSKYIDAAGKATGDKVKGKVYYNTICGSCHGLDGKAQKDMQPIGVVTNEDPWRGLHTIRNGRPAQVMPALRALDPQISGDTLAYAQTLPQ